jgi:hypothetical protein
MTVKTIKFAGNTYSEDLVPAAGGVQAKPLTGMNGGQLLELYNLVSSNLGRGRVKRFADTKSAIRRTWAILQEYAVQPEEGAEIIEPGDPRWDESKTHALVRDNGETVTDTKGAVTLTDTDKAQVASEAADRKTDELPKSEQLLQAAAAARREPTTSRRGNIWRRAKHEDAARTAYRPRPGSLQRVMYDALTREGGITMEDFCDVVEKSGSRDKMMYNPSGVWGGLRYLFVTLRGYGLDFDGERLRLLVPKDERETPAPGGGQKA